MAKLTARFDMKDGITNKLRSVRREIEKLKKARDKVNRPITMTARVRDRATAVLRKMDRFAERHFPRTRMMTIQARDRAMPIIQRVGRFARSSLSKGYQFSIRATDLASRTVNTISNFTRNNLPKAYNTTIRVIDLATKPLRMIASAATSTLGLLGVAGGIGGGIVVPIKMVADREDLTTAFEVMLGSKSKADARMKDLTDFAGRTPLTRDAIYKSSRILQTFTGDALSTSKGMELIGDVAVGTQTDLEETATWFGRLYDGIASGRPIGDATSRLQEMGAISGDARARIEKLAKSGGKIEKLWPQVTKEFSKYNGMMEKMSNNMNNLLLGLKSFVGNFILMPWGEGLRDVFKPALQSFRKWRGEYSFVLHDMSRKLKSSGSDFAKNLLNPFKPAFNFIGDQMKILFPGESVMDLKARMNDKEFKKWQADMRLKVEEDPEFAKRWLKLDEYRNMTFETRWRLVVDTTKDAIGEWWETKGRAKAESVGEGIGSAYGGFIRSAIISVLGGEAEKTGNPFIDAGITSGKSFITGFLEAIDPVDLSLKIGAKLRDINVDAGKSAWGHVTGNEELQKSGSIGGALIVDALALGVASTILTKFKPIKDLGSWVLDKTIRRGKDKPVPRVTPDSGKSQKPTPKKETTAKPKPVIVDQYGNPISSTKPESKPKPTPPPKPEPKSKTKPTTNKTDSKLLKYLNPKNWKVPKGADKVLKKVPIIGAAATVLSLFGTSKEDLPGVIGAAGGGVAGAMAGASIGSVIPVVGTAAGAVGGGILGAIGGEKLMNWVSVMFGPSKASAKDQPSGTAAGSGAMPDFSGINQQAQEMAAAFSNMSAKAQVASHNIEALTMTIGESAGWVAGAFHPLQGTTATLQHNIEALTLHVGEASAHVVSTFQPLTAGGGVLAHNIDALTLHLGQASASVVGAFQPIAGSGAVLTHNVDALTLYVGESSAHVFGAFNPLSVNGPVMNHNVTVLTQYLGEASSHVVGAFSPLAGKGPVLNQNVSALSLTLGMAAGWVATLNGIQSGAAAVKSALSNLAARIASVPTPNVSAAQPKEYAKGTRFHPGGPAIVGDGGGPELIRYPDGRTALSPASDTLLNLPRGAEVLSHRNTMKYLNKVPAYADGIGFDEEKARLSEGQTNAATAPPRSSGSSSTGGLRDITINFNGDNNYSNEMDAEKVGKIAYDFIRKALLNEEFEGGEMVIDV